MANLPLVTRNYTQIVKLSPGIAANVTDASELGRGSGGSSQGDFRAHGSFGIDNNFQMNGVPINDLQGSGLFSGSVAIPNPDAIQEFKVQTGQFDASFGRTAGANVNIMTRSGANKFHGTAFEYFRNDVLNANSFFRNQAGQERGVLKQNQFGFAVGGPIKKDKLLFFGSYQGTRQRNGVGSGSTSNFFLPPLTNDRSRAALGKMFAGRRGFFQNAFGGVGPAIAADGSNISAQALALLNLKLPNGEYVIPTPQTVNTSRPFDLQGFSALSIPAKFDEEQFLVNLDFLHTSKSSFAGRFFFANGDQALPLPPVASGDQGVPGFPVLIKNNNRNFSLSHTYSFGSTLFNQAEFGYTRIFGSTIQQEVFKFSDIGVIAPSNAEPYPVIAVVGALGVGGSGQALDHLAQNHYTVQDSLTWIRGRHTFRFGGGITRSQIDFFGYHFFGGTLFQSWPDMLLGLPGGPVAAGGNGTPISNVTLSIDLPGLFDRSWRVLDGHAYIQDDIKLTPSLTVNLGLRYDRLGHLGDKLGRNSGFDIALANPSPPAVGTLAGFTVSNNFQGTVPAGVTQLDNNFGVNGDGQNNVGPRVGFAWRLPKLNQMVLRGGYGLYYTRATGQPFVRLASAPPFAISRSLAATQNALASFARPFQPEVTLPQFTPYSPTTQRITQIIDPAYRAPITQQYSLNLQTDLGANFLLEVGYVGSVGTHQILAHSLNQARLASAASPIRGVTTNTVANIPNRVLVQGFLANGIADIDSVAESQYDGLEVSLTKRLSHGLQFLAAYTFAHAYSNGAAVTNAGGDGVPGNQNDRRANYGRSDFNRQHRLVLSYLYQLPSPQRFNAFVRGALSGWSVAGVTTFQSGAPLSLTGANTNNVFGITTDRAQLAAGCTSADLATPGSVTSKLNNYFNTSCIARANPNAPLSSTNAAVWPVIGDPEPTTGQRIATNFGNSGVGIVSGPDQRNFDIVLTKRTPFRMLGEGGNIEFRTEFFNAFNTPQFAAATTNVSSQLFGVIRNTAVAPRIIQFALKLNF